MIERVFTYALVAALLLVGAPALAQDEMPPEAAAEMAAWQAYMTPGEEHQQLAQGAGEWNHELTFWMEPGAAPQQATGTSTMESILGGRYLVETMTGTMMGMPFEGRGMYGYDNAKAQYHMSWIDNMGTGLMTGWGAPEGNKVTYSGTFVDPASGEDKPFRTVVTEVDPDHMIMEMYVPEPDGSGEFKNMEIHSYRETP
ncbi:MAG TPA: DUF1579 domain-containing protein [Gemmatimonadota bacterium]|nr:DUF1579 domain-containing protein [Gemmatimonadota bacterium]